MTKPVIDFIRENVTHYPAYSNGIVGMLSGKDIIHRRIDWRVGLDMPY